jgi:NUMOD4 motif
MTLSQQTGRPADAPPPGPEWKKIGGYSHYEWSHRGLVRSIDRTVGGRRYRGVTLKLRPNNSGYLVVNVTNDQCVKETVLVHRMILLAHDGEFEPGQETLHGPGGQLDNRWPENLRKGSHPENVAERVAAQPLKPPKPRTPCLNHEQCGGYVTAGGRRCHECVVELGVAAAALLEEGAPLDKVAEILGYPSPVGLHTLAVKYGDYGVQRPSWLRRVRNAVRTWLDSGDAP